MESRWLDALPDGVVVADADGNVVAINATARRLLEHGDDEFIGLSLSKAITLQNLEGRDWADCVRPYDGIQTRKSLLEASWRATSGAEVLVTGTLMRATPAGPVVQVALSLRDGRSRQVVDRERSDLVATVAHELRSPLTGVKGFTSTLLSKWDRFNDEQKLLMLRTVDADADRLTRLIAELLDVARIDSGRLSIRKELIDATEVIGGQIETMNTAVDRIISINADEPAPVWVDRDKLAQVMANLIENAVKHGEGDVEVTVTPAAGGGAEITVDDEGAGIDEEIRPRVFTKFWKHGRAGGSGLGLFIVGGLVEAHQGSVYVESSPAGGARLRVLLPYGEPEILN